MKRRLGIIAGCLDGIDTIASLEKIKKAGFDCFFTSEYKMDEVTKIKNEAVSLGLDYEFIHAPFHSINTIWTQGAEYLEVMEYMKESIDSASANKIPYVITHLSSGWYPPSVSDLGFERLDELVRYAREKGVTLAFENLRVLGNITCIMERYAKEKNVSFCFDCGHEHCYTKTVSIMDIFTTRVSCTHIHDNNSRGLFEKDGHFDLHLLPFDGTYNYEKMMSKLNEYGYCGALMLEVRQNYDEYKKLSHEEFLREAFRRIAKISNM